jgi:hypothetical protein
MFQNKMYKQEIMPTHNLLKTKFPKSQQSVLELFGIAMEIRF